ncbi:MAG TPA: hypothetical protein VGQ21_18265 [Thermoanaerobaculia bacterium]|jgi:hypothetical protein|nr:hypothetical protein [Thermoanaerobaculia bacterium]
MSDAADTMQPTGETPDPTDNQSDAQNGNGASESGKLSRVRPAKILPTDRIRHDKQLDILRAFAAASGHERKPVTPEDVGAIVGMAGSTITQITPFFVDTGLIVRAGDKKSDAKGFTPAAEVMAYQKAYEWDAANSAKKLAPVFVNSWFVTTLTPKLKFRAVNEKEAVNDLGEVAVVGPDKQDSLRIIIDYLVVAGIVDRDGGGMLRIGSAVAPQEVPHQNTPPPPPSPPPAAAAAGGVKPSNVSDHQLWLLEILNTYPDDVLTDADQEAILKLIKKIKGIGTRNAHPVTTERAE